MTDTLVIELAVLVMLTAAKILAPILVTTLVIGLVVSLVQAVTQIQEFTLTFVPKLVGVGLVLVIGGRWMLGQFIWLTNQLFNMLPRLLGQG